MLQMMFGFITLEIRKHAYDITVENHLSHLSVTKHKNKTAGKDWLTGF